jgi:hypothetical protein
MSATQLPVVLNEALKSAALHAGLARKLLKRRDAEPEKLVTELMELLKRALIVGKVRAAAVLRVRCVRAPRRPCARPRVRNTFKPAHCCTATTRRKSPPWSD